jgi:nitronate monooxygenase
MILDQLAVPIVLAPLAGGPSTPELAAAVSNAGGLGFLGAGYLSADALADQLRRTRELTSAPIGVNLFVIDGEPAAPSSYESYVEALAPEAARLGAEVGDPRFDDDGFGEKLNILSGDAVAVVSFTFGLPPATAVEALRDAGSEIWLTVTTPEEAEQAAAHGADALVVQGAEAGGHRGSFSDNDAQPIIPLLPLLRLIRARTDLPLVGAGGIATAEAARAARVAGATAAAAGTAFMLAPEAGTSDVHRQAIASPTPTDLTRAFTGKLARGIRNRFMDEHPNAPRAYPELHYATAPIRARARETGDPSVVNLWAGEAHELAQQRPAAEIVTALAP